MTLQQELERKSGKVVRRCRWCGGLIWQRHNEKAPQWQHVFREDDLRCFLPEQKIKGGSQ